LFFANTLRFRNEVRLLPSVSTPPKAILLNLHANFGIDLSATDTLFGLVAEAEKTETEVLSAELQNPVRQMFGRSGLLDRVRENSAAGFAPHTVLGKNRPKIFPLISLPASASERVIRRQF
jgi:MFS superfamily sulfate permease-like transporter